MNLLPLLHVVYKSCVLRRVECHYVVSFGGPCIPWSVCSLMHGWQRYNSKLLTIIACIPLHFILPQPLFSVVYIILCN